MGLGSMFADIIGGAINTGEQKKLDELESRLDKDYLSYEADSNEGINFAIKVIIFAVLIYMFALILKNINS